jgi:hypothetical protein
MAVKRPGEKRATSKERFLTGTDIPVIRVMDGKRRFFWAVKDNDGNYQRVKSSEWELK